MKIMATYGARSPDTQDRSGEVKHALSKTHQHTQEQLDWLVEHIDAEWEHISQFDGTSKMMSAGELPPLQGESLRTSKRG